jgi:hypothetical protein
MSLSRERKNREQRAERRESSLSRERENRERSRERSRERDREVPSGGRESLSRERE